MLTKTLAFLGRSPFVTRPRSRRPTNKGWARWRLFSERELFVMTKIYVGNLPFNATETDVRALFEQHGAVQSVALINDRETGRPRGFAFSRPRAKTRACDRQPSRPALVSNLIGARAASTRNIADVVSARRNC